MADTADTASAEKLTSEDVWKLIQPKIDEYWGIAKFVFWILVTVVMFFVGTIVGLLSVDAVRDTIIVSLIKIDKLFSDEKGKAFLTGELDRYLGSEKPTIVLFGNAANVPLKAKAIGAFDERFSAKLNSALNDVVVTYSFSTSFQLSDAKRSQSLRFLKPEGNMAEGDCLSVYDPDARKNVNITLNDFKDLGAVIPKERSAQGRGHFDVVKSNAKNFQDITKVNASQTVTFAVDADKPFEGTISIDCTITVSGPARTTQSQ